MSKKSAASSSHYDDQTRNVQLIMSKGFRLIGSPIPAQVRKELRAAVKNGVLGHIKKDGLLPEVFFHNIHPHCYTAVDARKREAAEAIKAIASVMVSPAEYRAGIEAMGGDVEQTLMQRAACTAVVSQSLTTDAAGSSGAALSGLEHVGKEGE